MLVKQRLDEYTANLRETVYPVTVYNDVLSRLLEADMRPAAETAQPPAAIPPPPAETAPAAAPGTS
jgi:hypothetical protein